MFLFLASTRPVKKAWESVKALEPAHHVAKPRDDASIALCTGAV